MLKNIKGKIILFKTKTDDLKKNGKNKMDLISLYFD